MRRASLTLVSTAAILLLVGFGCAKGTPEDAVPTTGETSGASGQQGSGTGTSAGATDDPQYGPNEWRDELMKNLPAELPEGVIVPSFDEPVYASLEEAVAANGAALQDAKPTTAQRAEAQALEGAFTPQPETDETVGEGE
jgi:hypothetical protein